jgi:hypothetical protein
MRGAVRCRVIIRQMPVTGPIIGTVGPLACGQSRADHVSEFHRVVHGQQARTAGVRDHEDLFARRQQERASVVAHEPRSVLSGGLAGTDGDDVLKRDARDERPPRIRSNRDQDRVGGQPERIATCASMSISPSSASGRRSTRLAIPIATTSITSGTHANSTIRCHVSGSSGRTGRRPRCRTRRRAGG